METESQTNPSRATIPWLENLLHHTGGYYPLIILALAQIIVTPVGIALAALILLFNAEFTSSQLIAIAGFTALAMLIRNACFLVGFHYGNKATVVRLDKWKKQEKLSAGTVEESKAWRQITLYSWRYIAIAFGTLMTFILIPVLIFTRNVVGATQDQLIYTLFSGIVAGISLALLEVLLIERMLIPARTVLLPKDFSAQIRGVLGFRLLNKFILVMVALIIVSALLITPIGYHQTVTVLFEEIGSLLVLKDLQLQSTIVVAIVIFIGIGLSFLLARSIANPVRQMIDIFRKIETGELGARVHVSATDEIGELAVHFNHLADRLEELQKNLEQRVLERTEQLRATIEIGQEANKFLDPQKLISSVVNLITDRFGYYYAAIFLTSDDNRWAVLVDATGEAGRILKSQKHRLEIGGKSMVGNAIAKNEARVALDVGIESVRFENPLLPQTRSEVALPLTIGNRVIGALDVQSIKEAAFDQENIITLQGMANQVAIALENARLFQEAQNSLNEIRSIHRAYLTSAWSSMAKKKTKFEFISSEATSHFDGATKTVEIPLTLREQPIGFLRLDCPSDVTAEEKSLLEAVATQAAIAMENARLLEESQQLALRERLVAEITGKIWSATNVDLILQTSIKELSRALRADEAIIKMD